MVNFRSNVLTKKAWRYGASVPRAWIRGRSSQADYLDAPPVLANSFPKSGTHLLSQILGSIPGIRDWGNFWASTPSFSLKEVGPRSMASAMSKVAPGELVCGHVHYDQILEEPVRQRNIVHYFVFRDPRDVAVSEAHYLANMNRWHKMHGHYRKLSDKRDQILLAIQGMEGGGFGYEDIGTRFGHFESWLSSPNVFAVSYEQLISDRKDEVIRGILEFYRRKTNHDIETERLVQTAGEAIKPSRSHTFRRGGSGGWRAEFDDEMKSIFKESAGELLIRLGYEQSFDW